MRPTHAPRTTHTLGSRPASGLWRAHSALALAVAFVSFALLSVVGCATEAPLFTRCAGGDECAPPADGCYQLFVTRSDGSEGSGRQCTLRCAGDSDCPEASVCLVLEGDPTSTPLCLATCALPADCYRGSRCTEVDGPLEVMSVCLP